MSERPSAESDATRFNITPLLRQRLIDGLINDEWPQDEAEALADDLMADARERGAALRARRDLPPASDRDEATR